MRQLNPEKPVVIFVYLIILALLLLFTMAIPKARAFDFTTDITGDIRFHYNFPSDKTLGPGIGIEGRAGYNLNKTFNSFFFLSYDFADQRLWGQNSGSLNLLGFGIGGRAKLNQYINLWIEGGYFVPYSDMQKSPQTYSEPLSYYWWEKKVETNTLWFNGKNIYSYSICPNWGGIVGFDLSYPVYKKFKINANAGYRFLKLRENFDYGPGVFDGSQNKFQTREWQNMNSPQLGIGGSYQW